MNVRFSNRPSGVPMVEVTLSERNLESLTAGLEEIKERGDPKGQYTLNRMTEDNIFLSLTIELDEAHYGGRNWNGKPLPPGNNLTPTVLRRLKAMKLLEIVEGHVAAAISSSYADLLQQAEAAVLNV